MNPVRACVYRGILARMAWVFQGLPNVLANRLTVLTVAGPVERGVRLQPIATLFATIVKTAIDK